MGRIHNRSAYTPRRKELRTHGTHAEAVLWLALRKSGLRGRKFRRQHGIGPFIVDFYCPAERLILELDGSVHDDPLRAAYDRDRQRAIETLGLRVLRIPNRAVLNRRADVLDWIAQHFASG